MWCSVVVHSDVVHSVVVHGDVVHSDVVPSVVVHRKVVHSEVVHSVVVHSEVVYSVVTENISLLVLEKDCWFCLEYDFYLIDWTKADFAPHTQINKEINKKTVKTIRFDEPHLYPLRSFT
jgi:hypothetical protein